MQTSATEILTNRFLLRPLRVHDVTERYVGWLSDQAVSQFIRSARLKPDISALQQYVLERSGRDEVIFLGIFDKLTGLHIGNIKYEPVNSELGYAVLGILVGEPHWRGKGVAVEVLLASAEWLRQHRNINQIVLGVSRTNTAAILAYQKAGFIEESTEFISDIPTENMTMILHLKPSHN